MEADQHFHAELVDVALVLVDLVIVGDHGVGQLDVALQERADGPLEIVTGLTGHRDHLSAQGCDRLIKIVKNVGVLHGSESLGAVDRGEFGNGRNEWSFSVHQKLYH